jgi:hypothetical protein
MKERIETYTLPILKEIENEDDQDQAQYEGSGVLYTHEGQYYILTAYHVLEELMTEWGFFIPSGEEMININGKLTYNENLDIAILKIDESDVCKFRNYEFITRDMIAFPNLKEIEEVFLLGYPSSRSHFVPKSSEVKYTLVYGKAKLQNTMKHDARRNDQIKMFIKYPEDWSDGNLPHPRGMSGTGVWLNDNNRLRLIGINNYFDGTNIIEAIKIQVYMKALENITNRN